MTYNAKLSPDTGHTRRGIPGRNGVQIPKNPPKKPGVPIPKQPKKPKPTNAPGRKGAG